MSKFSNFASDGNAGFDWSTSTDGSEPSFGSSANTSNQMTGLTQQPAGASAGGAKFVDPNANVYIYGIPAEWNDAELQQVFGQFGPIVSSKVVRKADGSGKGYAFVGYWNPADAQNAISTFNGVEIGGRELVVRLKDDPGKGSGVGPGPVVVAPINPKSNVYIYGLPAQWGDDELQQVFGQFGNIVSTKVPRNEDGSSKGYGFVAFVSPVSAQTAITTFDNTEIEGRKLTVRLKDEGNTGMSASPMTITQKWQQQRQPFVVPPLVKPLQPFLKQQQPHWAPVPSPHLAKQWTPNFMNNVNMSKAGAHVSSTWRKPMPVNAGTWTPRLPSVTPPGCAARVFYMPGNWTEMDVTRHFSHCGDITGVLVVTNPDGRSKGLGFVNFTSPECVLKAVLAMDGFAAAESRFLSVAPKTGEEDSVPPLPDLPWPQQGDAAMGPTSDWTPPGGNIFVYYLPPSWTEEELYRHFIHYGDICTLSVEQGKGYGFVGYRNKLSAVRALKGMNGFDTGKKRLEVTIKKGEESEVQAEMDACAVIPDYQPELGGAPTVAMPARVVPPVAMPARVVPPRTMPMAARPVPMAAHAIPNKVKDVPAGANLYVSGLPQTWQEADLQGTFSQFGTIISMRLIRNNANGTSMGYGFVGYDNPDSAAMAQLELNDLEVTPGKKLVVKQKEEKGAASTSEATFGGTWSGGDATGSNLLSLTTNGDSRNGDLGTTPKEVPALFKQTPYGANVYITGFPDDWTEADLEANFSQYGNIVSTKVARHKDGNSMCYGFVGFGLAEGAKQAIENSNGMVVEGKKLTVKIKEDKGLKPY